MASRTLNPEYQEDDEILLSRLYRYKAYPYWYGKLPNLLFLAIALLSFHTSVF